MSRIACFLSLLLVTVLAGCYSVPVKKPDSSSQQPTASLGATGEPESAQTLSSRRWKHRRTFFNGDLVYTMEDQHVRIGMFNLESLLVQNMPDSMQIEDPHRPGQKTLPERHFLGLYGEASGNDQHITAQELAEFQYWAHGMIESNAPSAIQAFERGG